MMALTQSFNEQKGVPHFDAAANDAHFKNILDDVNLRLNDIDVVYNAVTNSGNEQGFEQILELASVTGDKLGKMGELAEGVDQSMQAREGNRTVNLSGEERLEHREEFLTRQDQTQIETLDYAPPPVRSEDDLEMALSELCLLLDEAGVPEHEIQNALAAGGVDNNFAKLEAFKELAQDYKVPEAQGYLNIVENYLIEAKLLPEPVLAVAAPAFNPNDPRFGITQNQPSAMRMG